MTQQDARAFGSALAAARASFGQPFDEGVTAVYWGVLERYDLDDVLKALSAAVARADRMPAPGVIAGDLRDARKRRHLEAQTARYLAEPAPRIALPPPKKPTAPPPTRRRRAARRETDEQARQRLAAQAAELGITRADIEAAKENR